MTEQEIAEEARTRFKIIQILTHDSGIYALSATGQIYSGIFVVPTGSDEKKTIPKIYWRKVPLPTADIYEIEAWKDAAKT